MVPSDFVTNTKGLHHSLFDSSIISASNIVFTLVLTAFLLASGIGLGSACQEVQDPVAEGGVQSQGPKLSVEL
jgi:hypothetical protein